jgi:hypothetical protein
VSFEIQLEGLLQLVMGVEPHIIFFIMAPKTKVGSLFF